MIIPGIESVNQTILNNIRKGTTVEQIENYIANARKAGLMVHACYMVGNNGETRETMEQTLAAAMRFKTDTAQFFPLIPYPGTEAYEWARSNNYINGKYDEYVHEDGTLNCIINTPALSAQDLVDFCSYARKKYYLRPWVYCASPVARTTGQGRPQAFAQGVWQAEGDPVQMTIHVLGTVNGIENEGMRNVATHLARVI